MTPRLPPSERRRIRHDRLTGIGAVLLVLAIAGVFVWALTGMTRWTRTALEEARADDPGDMTGAAPVVVGPLPERPVASPSPSAPAAMPEPHAPPPPAGAADSANPGDPSAPGAPPRLTAAPRRLAIPVDGVSPDELHPSFDEPRGSRPHEAIDIMAPHGTPVRAVADGRVAKLFTSDAGGLTVYQFDRDERIAYYYAHLHRYRDGLAEGAMLERGELLGYVGTSGNAAEDAPHLHFAVFVLGPEKRWWEGRAIDPYPLLRGSPR